MSSRIAPTPTDAQKRSPLRPILCLLAIACALAAGCAKDKAKVPKVSGRNVLTIVAPRDFRDEELLEPRAILEKAGASVKIASTTLDEIGGALGARIKPDLLLQKVVVKDFDAIVFIGGPGGEVYFDHAEAHRIAQHAAKEKKVLAAICIAPCILANAGVLKNVKATVWAGDKMKRILQEGGAQFQTDPVVRDGRISTANGPEAAKDFAAALAKALAE